MLTHLYISNFALIDQLEVSFSEGLTCITGETGAGKSILLGGLSLVLGKRADLTSLLDPEKKCVVEATFSIERYGLQSLFEALDLDYDSITVVRRELLPQGKSRAFVNDTPVNLNVLEEIAAALIDIHSQHDNLQLGEGDFQFYLLDALAGNQELVINYQSTLSKYKTTLNEKDRLLLLQKQSQEDYNLNQFLFNELQEANLVAGKEEELERKRTLLNSVEYLGITLSEIIQLIEQEEVGIMDQLYRLRQLIYGLSQKSDHFDSLSQQTQNSVVEIEDLLEASKHHLDQLEADPETLKHLDEQWDQLHSLFLKHHVNSTLELLKIKDNLEKELEQSLNLEQQYDKVNNEINSLLSSLLSITEKLKSNRNKVIPILEKEIKKYLDQMGMKEAQFKIEMKSTSSFLPFGSDELTFLFNANLGGEFKPLKKVASGGELSRIMLAIKSILSQYKKLPTLIFDEIDTGVSGQISDRVAEVMSALSKNLQVFTITHLPQVAAKGKHHLKVEKTTLEGKTFTRLRPLNFEERIHEIAIMLSGNQVTPTAVAHAKQLMN
ncbi:MAG: DNA repair protein RecN [Flavobacteriaceae bacterium]